MARTTRQTTSRRTSRRGTIIRVVGVLAVVAVCLLGTRFVSPEEAEAILAGTTVDPDSYADSIYDADVVPYVQDNAVDVVELVTDLQEDADGTAEKYGKRDGEAAYTYAVTATGTVGPGDFGQVNLSVDGLPSGVTVAVQTGPALTGTALRDVTGETTFDMFRNQIDYAEAGLQLNEHVKTDVLANKDLVSMEGSTVTVVGAFAYSDPAHLVIVPVSIEAAS